jgi:Cft2 family RNA processing exonuclease
MTSTLAARISHHGAVDGVTGSCHQLSLPDGQSVLVDCGLFQGAETSREGAGAERLDITFPIDRVRALVVSHVHIDHVGRIPRLLAAGYRGPIVCSQASAALLPLVLEDALKVGFTRDQALISGFLKQIRQQTIAVPYKQWRTIISGEVALRVRLSPAGHILGSAYVEFDLKRGQETQRVVFSGDLGAPYTPLLPAPRSPYGADVVVLESTYGDRTHESRKDRRQRLQALCERCFGNKGSLLIPAFSIGRTQELLYELEEIIHRNRQRPAAPGVTWDDLDIIVDSPLAADFTAGYGQLREHWDSEARRKLAAGRHPLAFEQLTTIDDHATHLGPSSTWRAPRARRSSSPPAACAAAAASSTTSRRCSATRATTSCSSATRRPARRAGKSSSMARRAAMSTSTASATRSAPASTPSAATPPMPTRRTCSTSSAACAKSHGRSAWCMAMPVPSSPSPPRSGNATRTPKSSSPDRPPM